MESWLTKTQHNKVFSKPALPRVVHISQNYFKASSPTPEFFGHRSFTDGLIGRPTVLSALERKRKQVTGLKEGGNKRLRLDSTSSSDLQMLTRFLS